MQRLAESFAFSIPQHVVTGQFGSIPTELLLDRRVNASAVRLYGLLAAKYCDFTTRIGVVSRAALAADLGLDLSTVRRRLAELRKAGWLRVKRRRDRHGYQTVNAFHVGGQRGKNAPLVTPGARGPEGQKRPPKDQRDDQRRARGPRAGFRGPTFGLREFCPHGGACTDRLACVARSCAEAREEARRCRDACPAPAGILAAPGSA
jgi:DNA-binding transcriptional ArsR family regulator